MIKRQISTEFLTQLNEYPIVTVLGPRQSGKTTLVRNLLPNYEYVNLEQPDVRALAQDDPNAFLKRYSQRTIFDEIQRVPELLSYLQVLVDDKTDTGQFVLTGSHQLSLRAAITQSLAGRTGILNLLPLSIEELSNADYCFDTFEEYIHRGFLPRIYDKNQRPTTAYANYYKTYLERDVRQLINLKDASLFEKFIKLLAGRVGQLTNYESLSNDVGVDGKTIKQWLSILEASFIIFKLPPYFENFGKRLIKSPKYYFLDTGLLCFLLDIEQASQVTRDPLVGNMFENLIVLEALKTRYNQGKTSDLYFFRDSSGNEIDLILSKGRQLTGIEIKSSSTWHDKFKKTLLNFSNNTTNLANAFVIYNGKAFDFSDGVCALTFKDVPRAINMQT